MVNVFTKDSLRDAVESASGGRNTILYDAAGNPNYMVVVPKFDLDIYGITGLTGTHKAFVYNDDGDEVPYIFIGKYPASRLGNSIVSMPNQTPITSLDTPSVSQTNLSEFVGDVKNKGLNWHCSNALEHNAYILKHSLRNNQLYTKLPNAITSSTGGTTGTFFYCIIDDVTTETDDWDHLLERLENIDASNPADDLDEYSFYFKGQEENSPTIIFKTFQYQTIDNDSAVVWFELDESTFVNTNDILIFKGKEAGGSPSFEYELTNLVPVPVGDNYSDDFESSADGTPYGMMGCYNLEYIHGLELTYAEDGGSDWYRSIRALNRNYNGNETIDLSSSTLTGIRLINTGEYSAGLGDSSETDAIDFSASTLNTYREYSRYNTKFTGFGPSEDLEADAAWTTYKEILYSLGLIGTAFSSYDFPENGEYPPSQNDAVNNIQFYWKDTGSNDYSKSSAYFFKDNLFSYRFAPKDHIMGITQFSDTWSHFISEDYSPWGPCTFRISYIPLSGEF
jgi:hypothetical protein